MKLTNYKRGYQFDCSIHGTIYMTSAEWVAAYKYIKANPKLLNAYDTTGFYLDIFEKDVKRTINIKNGFRINVRVPATEAIVAHFGLKNYKRANYQIEVSL